MGVKISNYTPLKVHIIFTPKISYIPVLLVRVSTKLSCSRNSEILDGAIWEEELQKTPLKEYTIAPQYLCMLLGDTLPKLLKNCEISIFFFFFNFASSMGNYKKCDILKTGGRREKKSKIWVSWVITWVALYKYH